MIRGLENIFWLGLKELRSVFSDVIMVVFIVWSFTFSISERAKGMSEAVNNASVGFVDEDRSALSRTIRTALFAPYFQQPELIEARDVQRDMDQNKFMFVVSIPPNFEADVRKGLQPVVQLNIDATAIGQAGLGASYLQNIINDEVQRYFKRSDVPMVFPVTLVMRRAFNANGTQGWFSSIVALLDQLTMLTIILTGAALLREREHGTIEHLLVMPLTSFQIAMAKVWANGLVILVAFTISLNFVVEGLLEVPVAGSKLLLLSGTVIYLFAAAAIGIFLGTIARTMAQFALLMLLTIMPMIMLSGGMSPIESQPELIQPLTWFLPSRHYMSFAQAVVFRGAGLDIVWPQFLTVAFLGLSFFTGSLLLFRRSIAVAK